MSTTATTASVTDNGTELFIPLNKLKKSPRNARRTPHSEAAIEALAASIAAKGILQNLVVEPELDGEGAATGCYFVTVGEGRRLAQLLRVKRKEIKKTEPVRCIVDTVNNPHEISLDENVTLEAILAVQLFVTLIEFKLTTLAGFVLIPFALFNRTAFLAEKVLGNIVASGIKVMVLAVIVGIGTGLFSQFTAGFGGGQPTVEQALSVVLAALALLGLGIFGPGIANGLVSGAPQLGAGAAVGTGLAVAGAAVGAAAALGGGGAALAGAGRMTAAAARGGASMAGAASSAYTLASAGQSGAGGAASGLGGVGRAAAAAASAPVRRAAASAGSAMEERFAEGARSGFVITGGSSTMGSVGAGTQAANDAGPAAASSSPPNWAQRARRSQTVSRGVSTAMNAVRSGDSNGAGHSVDLSEKEF